MTRIVKNPLERREEIIFAAKKLFLKKEYEKTSLNDVVTALKIAKGTIYHYFKTKEALLDAVVDNMAEEYVQMVKDALGNNNTSALNRFQKLVKASYVKPKLQKTINQLHRSGNIGLHVRLLALSIKKIAPLYADVIQQGCKEGVFKTDCPLETAEILLAGIQFITDVGFYPWKKVDIARRTKVLSTLTEAQLGAKKGFLSFLNKI